MVLLGFSDVTINIIYKMLYGVYFTVGRVYNLVLKLIDDTANMFNVEDFVDKLYVIVGVFMLFRITISLLQMLINPDQVSDKNVGAGKLMTRIIIAFLLLILFYPQSFLLKSDGLLDKFQDGVIGANGLLENLFYKNQLDNIDIDSSLEDESTTENKIHFSIKDFAKHLWGTAIFADKYILYQSLKYILDNLPEGVEFKLTPRLCEIYFAELEYEKKNKTNRDSEKMVELNPDLKNCDSKIFLKENLNTWKATAFATDSMNAFFDCTSSKKTKLQRCEGRKEVQFFVGQTQKAGFFFDSGVPELMAEDEVEVSFLTGVIAGIVIIVFLVILSVDVIIRNLKLLLLNILAPIAIMSYIDPKDKVFNSWIKMYASVFLDLFIKLFALKFAIELIANLSTSDISGIEYFFVIIAILLFAKLIPDMISKIFGIDMNGSMKQIGSMVKAGAGAVAGGIAGGIAGAITGTGRFGRISGALGGALRGAGSGAKGKLLGGAQSISAYNAKEAEGEKDGLNWFQRRQANLMGTAGISPKKKMDTAIKDKVDQKQKYDDWRKQKDAIEEAAEKSAALSDLKVKLANGEIGKDTYKAAKKAFIIAAEKGESTFSYVNENGEAVTTAVDGADKVQNAIKDMHALYEANSSLRNEVNSAYVTQQENVIKSNITEQIAAEKGISVDQVSQSEVLSKFNEQKLNGDKLEQNITMDIAREISMRENISVEQAISKVDKHEVKQRFESNKKAGVDGYADAVLISDLGSKFDYAEYLDSEASSTVAFEKIKEEIIRRQNSDEYIKAKSMEEFAKGNKE